MLNWILALISGRAQWAQVGPVLIGITLALLAGITFHEFAHALVAYRLGDPTPKRMGRVTLNPSAHIDPMGALLFFLAGFGWGRPVQFQPYLLRMNPRIGSALVALAGPTANFILAVIFGTLFRVLDGLVMTNPAPGTVFGMNTLLQFIQFNIILGFYNLIPIPPLDGFSILVGILPADLAYRLESVRQYGFLLLLLLVFAGGGIIGAVLLPPVQMILNLVTGL
jgi:Zn-dependent protease